MSEPRRWTLYKSATTDDWRSKRYEGAGRHEVVVVIEAAPVEAELERLRAENNGLYEQIAAAGEDVGEMEAELDRLRRIEVAARKVASAFATRVDLAPFEVHGSHIPKNWADELRAALEADHGAE